MRAWEKVSVPSLDRFGHAPALRIHDTATGRPLTTGGPSPAGLYVCGITPYDSTHLGHAATYVAFDLLNRAWRDSGREGEGGNLLFGPRASPTSPCPLRPRGRRGTTPR